ncbi:MAG: hypothetical protein M3R72_10675 [Bacteroidota bacterium]|nr:hypothetical protein [Bacteroidota bacterium]
MKIIHYIRLLLRKLLWVLLVPIICAGAVYYFTRTMPKDYISNTTLYTGVASGYSITGDDEQRIDYFAVNNAFDNLLATAKSRETIGQVAMHLLAEHLLLRKPDAKELSSQSYENLKKVAGEKLMHQAQQLGDTQSVYNYLQSVYDSKADNPIARILDAKGSFYSINDITSNITISRINTSDMVQIVYTCSDPAVCMRTLELHSLIFMGKYKSLKVDQTSSAVDYFEKKLAEVKGKLQVAEDNLKDFGKDHQIINYYEQTRYIAQSKEEVDKEIYRMKEERDASSQALKLVESKLNSREKQITNSTNLMRLRQNLGAVNAQLEVATVYNNAQKISELTDKRQAIEDSIKHETSNYNNLSYSIETVPRTNLIQEWVNNAISYDKANANINVLNTTRGNYLDEYSEFAPLGSSIKRLDRQIDINEQEFLSILHGLNLARLRQSSISLSSNLVVIDAPFFPLVAQASKRLLLVMAAFLVGFITVGFVVIGKEVSDASVRTPERAKKIIGLPLGGVALSDDPTKAGKLYKSSLATILTEQLVTTLLPFINSAIDAKNNAQISFITTKADVYKAKDILVLHQQFSALYPDLLWAIPEQNRSLFSQALPAHSFAVYTPSTEQLNYKCVSRLIGQDISSHRLILYVSPNMSRNALPHSIIKSSAANLLVFDAKTVWQPAERELLAKTKNIDRNIPFYTWLVNTSDVNIDGVVGEIPKKRNWLRRKVKEVVAHKLS